MSGINSDQLHRSTLGIYSNLMEEFNPSLQRLVSLGNSYMQAFQTLAATSEAYFSALSKIGERALHTASSRSIGDVLIRISENQRMLTTELKGVFHWFSVEVLQAMDKNVQLDRDYLAGSRRYYETEVHNQAVALDRQLRRGANQDCSEYVQFLRRSHEEALQEEERRHRFLAEKHCGLLQTIANLMDKTVGSLQQRTNDWTDEVNATRQPEARRSSSVYSSTGMREDEMRRNREEPILGRIPSRAPSPQGSISSSGGGGRGDVMRARTDHQPISSNRTLLPFSKGETITLLVQQPKNGWLYGRADSAPRPGWFPATYVEAMDDPPNYRLRSSSSNSSMSSLYDQSRNSNYGGAPPPAPPPPPQFSNRQSERQLASHDRRAEASSEDTRSKPHGSQPELFPRGTNPFATVKLKPTHTDDRSAPRFNR
ncbi:brain-specific angiogenesis inhibitor 1-associated protein 2-like protein 2 isoform X1 [Larimichthys crocea]|uniref:brain-specific angiogenesis inhibitor 1-associated protein 2-like protein 2 isoform X1 n=1 Tax=Larimichthys crocea TaxID=215358 RepID=UPI000F5D5D9D|nr:brain-specific angiogenesis inhibitor 1-associated protein 2-like protein 2 isoform X1 [Larimichthys crocea]